MNRRSVRTAVASALGLLAIALLVCGLAPGAQAQGGSVPEIPLTFRSPFAARYAGMGGASIAFADDHVAVLSNPATLGLVRSIEVSIGFNRQDGSRDVTYKGREVGREFGKTRLSHLGFAYPFPTYRGSLVVGLAYGRASGLDSDYLMDWDSGSGIAERETIYEDGGLGSYSAALATQVSRDLTLGITGTILGGNDYRLWTYDFSDQSFAEFDYSETDSDFSGVTGSVGALLDAGSGVRLGVVLHFPEWIDVQTTGEDAYINDDADYGGPFTASESIDLPFRLGAGAAFARKNLILALDAIYADWTQIDYGGPMRTESGLPAYDETLGIRAGGELLLPTSVPTRLRIGYMYDPSPYRLVVTTPKIEVDQNNDRYVVRNTEEASFEKNRQYLTLGAGVLLRESMTIDLAYMHGGFTRASGRSGIFKEEESDRRLLASLSFRLR
ncbi:MAG: hypothetical protein FJY88_01245 [Candidatus Eisenbacteria bacterium]|nr:hypothetical protein [Candidatus Eisenbacteria bacterium]